MPKMKMTMDRLAGMINRGFESVGERFESMDRRFESVEKGIRSIKDSQDDIQLRFSEVAYRFELEGVKDRVGVLERKLKIRRRA